MPRVPDLVGRIRLDTRDLDRAKGDVAKFGRDVNSAGGKIGQGLASGLDSATSALTGGFGAAGLAAKTKLDALGTSALASGSALKLGLAGGAVGAGLILTKFATDGVDAFLSLAEQVRDFGLASGASTEDSSRFIAVLDDLQISADAGASAVFKLGREVAAGAPKLRALGIEVARNKDGTANLTETLLNVADAYAKAPDQATKTAIAFAAFGKQAQVLLPLLSRGREGLEEFFASAESHGQILSPEDAAQAEELRLAIDELNDALRGIQIIGAKALVPLIEKVAELGAKAASLVQFVQRNLGKDSISSGLGAAGRSLPVIGPLLAASGALSGGKSRDSADDTKESVDSLTGSIEGMGNATQEEIATAEAWAATNKRAADILASVAKATDARHKAVLSVVDAEQANRRAIVSFSDAVADVRDKERDLADARRGRTSATRDAISIERALNSVEDANSSIVDQEKALADARAGRGTNARELADAEKELARAREEAAGARGVKAAKEAGNLVADAEERVRRAREDGGQDEDIRAATEALSRAQLDAREASLALTEARASGANRVKEAEDALAASQAAALSAALAQARTFQDLAEQRAEALGIPLSVDESYNVFRNKLIEVKDGAVGPLRAELEGVINQIGELPAEKTIKFGTPGLEEAITRIGALATTIGGIRSDVDFISSLGAFTAPTLTAPGEPGVPALTGASGRAPTGAAPTLAGRTSTTTNINTTVVAPGVNADVAREIDKRTARAAARAR